MLSLVLYLKFLERKRLLKAFFCLICSLYFGFKFNLLYNLKKCPECYGDDLCKFFQNRHIQLTWFSCFLLIINPIWRRSVFHGFFNETKIVIKRKTGRSAGVDFNDFILNNDNAQNFILCPNVKDVRFLLDPIQHGIEGKRLWLDMKASIEPLLLLYFKSENIWSLPEYHGACGDFIVEEYKGEPLSNFLSSTFEKKCLLAIELLQMVHSFTFKHPTVAFYFTDYSLHNLVVDSNGKVSLIDLDNMIIFNKSANEGRHSLTRGTHTSKVFNDHKYAFSPQEICSHNISDHNYFSVCKFIFTHPENGLLREVSAAINKHKELLELLNECTQPKVMRDRFFAGQKLLLLLEEITNGYSW